MTIEALEPGGDVVQRVHDISTMLYLYQTKPATHMDQIDALQTGLTNAIRALHQQGKQHEVLPAIGPLALSSLAPSLPGQSELAGYVESLIILESGTR